MPFDEVYSAIFYVEAVYGGRFEHRRAQGSAMMRRLLSAGEHPIYVMRRRDGDRIESDVKSRLVVLAQTEHWIACEL